MTTIEVTEDRVIIRRGGVNPQVIGLTFAEVAAAADILRGHLLALTPVEVPTYPRCGSAYVGQDNEGLVCTRSPGHYGAHGPAATGPYGAPPDVGPRVRCAQCALMFGGNLAIGSRICGPCIDKNTGRRA